MIKRFACVILSIFLIINVLPSATLALKNSEDIIILYENDVHCVVEGYSKISALKKELKESYDYVGVVSAGDYIQGNSLGVISQGEYIINIMNLIGYDAIALGNHEFDYRLNRLEELIAMMDTKPICCNFQKSSETTPYFQPYNIVSYGEIDIAYIGITTPSTITSSAPSQFKDENGNFIYTFNSSALYDIVQSQIDSAKLNGADYVIAISHIGYAEDEMYADIEDVVDLIENIDGLDVVLDAHSHSVIENKIILDKCGNKVVLSSTGSKFENIGKLTISNGEIKTELIKTESYTKTDPVVDSYILQINDEAAEHAERYVAFSEVELVTHDPEGNRLVRVDETNLGDLIADSLRYALNTDISYMNGGGIRTNIKSGDITFKELLDVLPFNNTIVSAEISGQTIKDLIEMSVMNWPKEDGCFPHMSGVTFSVNKSIPSSVIVNEQEEFCGVSGEYRVYDIKIYNDETGIYEPLDLKDTYTIATSDYFLLQYGSGMNMLQNCKIIRNEGILDVEALEHYIVEKLNGLIGQEYAETQENIKFTDKQQ